MATEYFRLVFSEGVDIANTSVSIGEVEIVSNPIGGEGAYNVIFGQPVTASSTYNDPLYDPSYAVDGNFNTYWASDEPINGTSLAVPPDASLDIVDYYRIRIDDPFELGYAPVAWTLEATDDPAGLIGWTVIDSRSGQVFSDAVWNTYIGPFSLSNDRTVVDSGRLNLLSHQRGTAPSPKRDPGRLRGGRAIPGTPQGAAIFLDPGRFTDSISAPNGVIGIGVSLFDPGRESQHPNIPGFFELNPSSIVLGTGKTLFRCYIESSGASIDERIEIPIKSFQTRQREPKLYGGGEGSEGGGG